MDRQLAGQAGRTVDRRQGMPPWTLLIQLPKCCNWVLLQHTDSAMLYNQYGVPHSSLHTATATRMQPDTALLRPPCQPSSLCGMPLSLPHSLDDAGCQQNAVLQSCSQPAFLLLLLLLFTAAAVYCCASAMHVPQSVCPCSVSAWQSSCMLAVEEMVDVLPSLPYYID